VYPFGRQTPLGCHYHRAKTGWEITLFAARTEIVGGPRDGEQQPARFAVNLAELCSVFDSIESFRWQAHRYSRRDEIGPHVAVEGKYRGQTVWLRIPAAAPKQFPPGRQTRANSSPSEELW